MGMWCGKSGMSNFAREYVMVGEQRVWIELDVCCRRL